MFEVPSVANMMQTAVDNGVVGFVGECGQSPLYATYHVSVPNDWLRGGAVQTVLVMSLERREIFRNGRTG